MAALRRFRALLDAMRPGAIYAVATAAVREARDGLAFAKRVKDETGIDLDILSGEDEARFAALGVVAGAPEAGGVAGDLGGYSLELVRIQGRQPANRVTLPLGPFAFTPARDTSPLKEGELQKAIARALEPVAGAFASQCFYAVGGAWRNLGLLHMQMSRYPLEILHQYEISAREACETARFVARQSKSSLERI